MEFTGIAEALRTAERFRLKIDWDSLALNEDGTPDIPFDGEDLLLRMLEGEYGKEGVQGAIRAIEILERNEQAA